MTEAIMKPVTKKVSVRQKVLTYAICLTLGAASTAAAGEFNSSGGPNFSKLVSINLKNERPAAYTLDIANPNDPAYAKDSSVHISYDGEDTGGWLTSVGSNNFWLSSGTAYESTVGQWIQKSPVSGCSSMQGSGDAGFRVFMQCGNPTINTPITPVITMRMKHDSETDKSATLEIRGGLQLNNAMDTNVDLANGGHAVPAVKPTCSSAKAGTFWYTRGSAGVKDSIEICAKYADDTFGWRALSF